MVRILKVTINNLPQKRKFGKNCPKSCYVYSPSLSGGVRKITQPILVDFVTRNLDYPRAVHEIVAIVFGSVLSNHKTRITPEQTSSFPFRWRSETFSFFSNLRPTERSAPRAAPPVVFSWLAANLPEGWLSVRWIISTMCGRHLTSCDLDALRALMMS